MVSMMKKTVVTDKLSRKNAEGYPDPTAYEAVKDADEELMRFRKLMGAIYRICELSDFQLEEHIVVKDKRTGKVWR